MNKGQRHKFEIGIKEVAARDHHMWNQLASKQCKRNSQNLLPRGCRTFLLELFTGAALLTHMTAIDYELPVSEPLNLKHNKLDLTTETGRRQVEDLIARDDPYVIACSYQDPIWSVWGQVLNGTTWDSMMAARKQWTPFVKWIFKVVRERIEKGRQFILEHPTRSDAWNLAQVNRELQNPPSDGGTLEHLEALNGDSDNMRYQEVTYVTATLEVKNKLLTCHNSGRFSPTEPPVDRSPTICQAILGFVDSLDNLHTRTAFPAEAAMELEYGDEAEMPLIDAILGPADFVTADSAATTCKECKDFEEKDVMTQEGPLPALASEEAEPLQARRTVWRELDYGQRVALRRLHNMTGHSSPAAMQRLLRTAGADPKVIRALEHFSCPSCDSVAKPKKAAAAKMPSEYVFNHEVSLDVFIVKDCRGERHKILSMVDFFM